MIGRGTCFKGGSHKQHGNVHLKAITAIGTGEVLSPHTGSLTHLIRGGAQ